MGKGPPHGTAHARQGFIGMGITCGITFALGTMLIEGRKLGSEMMYKHGNQVFFLFW